MRIRSNVVACLMGVGLVVALGLAEAWAAPGMAEVRIEAMQSYLAERVIPGLPVSVNLMALRTSDWISSSCGADPPPLGGPRTAGSR